MSNTSGRLTRVEALHQARADALISGLRQEPVGAAILDTWARGEIDGDEARRRLDARLAAELGGRPGSPRVPHCGQEDSGTPTEETTA